MLRITPVMRRLGRRACAVPQTWHATPPTVWRLSAEPDLQCEKLAARRDGDGFTSDNSRTHRLWTHTRLGGGGPMRSGCVVFFIGNVLLRTNTNAWQWQSTPVPRALVFERRLERTLPDRARAARRRCSLPEFLHDPICRGSTPTCINGRSSTSLVNAAAPYLEQQQIKDFVANGGGLVVLGGFWAFNCGGYRSGYKDGVLADTLPVTWPTNFDVPGSDAGWPPHAGPPPPPG